MSPRAPTSARASQVTSRAATPASAGNVNSRSSAVAGVVALALLAGCSASIDDGPGARADAAPVTVRFTFFGDAVEAAGYLDLVDAFEAANPDVEVDAQPVASKADLLARLTTAFAGGDPPDLFLVNFREFGQFAGEGVLEPLQPRLDGSTVLSEDAFFTAPLDAFRFDHDGHGSADAVTCLPQNVSSLVAYVNLDLLARAGVAVPYDGWDTDGFLAALQAVDALGDDVHGLVTTPDLVRLAPWVWSAGGEVVDDPAAPTRLALLDTPQARAAVDAFLDLSLVHGVVPSDVEDQALEGEARFLAGDVGVYLNSRKAVPTLRTIDGFAWDVVPIPTAPGGTAVTMLHADGYCLTAGLDDAVADAAFRLVEFALGPEGAPIVAASGRTVPSNMAVARSGAFLDDRPPANAQLFLANAELVRATPSTASWARAEDRADDLLEQAWYGRVDREDALRRLVDETAPLLATDP